MRVQARDSQRVPGNDIPNLGKVIPPDAEGCAGTPSVSPAVVPRAKARIDADRECAGIATKETCEKPQLSQRGGVIQHSEVNEFFQACWGRGFLTSEENPVRGNARSQGPPDFVVGRRVDP